MKFASQCLRYSNIVLPDSKENRSLRLFLATRPKSVDIGDSAMVLGSLSLEYRLWAVIFGLSPSETSVSCIGKLAVGAGMACRFHTPAFSHFYPCHNPLSSQLTQLKVAESIIAWYFASVTVTNTLNRAIHIIGHKKTKEFRSCPRDAETHREDQHRAAVLPAYPLFCV